MQETTLNYSWVPITVKKNSQPALNLNCNSITLINYGTSTVRINDAIILYPGVPGTRSGESISIGGNRLEIFKGVIDVAFNSVVPGANLLVILQKIYIP